MVPRLQRTPGRLEKRLSMGQTWNLPMLRNPPSPQKRHRHLQTKEMILLVFILRKNMEGKSPHHSARRSGKSPALILFRMMRKTLPARPLVPRHKNGKTRCGEPHSSKDKRVWSKTSLGHQISPMGGKRNRRVCQGSGSPLILQKETGSRGGEKAKMAPVPLGHILRRRADSKDIFPQRTVPMVEKMPPLSKVGKGRGCWGPSAKCFIRWTRKRC